MAQRMVDLTVFSHQNNILDWFFKESLTNEEPSLDPFQKKQLYSSLCFFKVRQSKTDPLSFGIEDKMNAKHDYCNYDNEERNGKHEIFNMTNEIQNEHGGMDLLMQAMQTLQDIDGEAHRQMDEINTFEVRFDI